MYINLLFSLYKNRIDFYRCILNFFMIIKNSKLYQKVENQSMGFIRLVTFYKILGAFVWSVFFNNILLSRIISYIVQLFGTPYLYQFEMLSLITLPVVMYTFIKTLKNVPTPISLLHLTEFGNHILWIFCFWTYLYFVASASFDYPLSIIASTLICVLSVYNQNHAFYFNFANQSRFQRFCDAFRSHIIASILIGVILFFLGGSYISFFAAFQLFLCSDVIFAITIVVASEPVSFASQDNKRFLKGLNSKDPYERFLSFQDLYAISKGNDLRRKFLFKDPSGRVFSSVVESCSKLMISFSNRQNRMIQMGNFKAPIHRVNDGQWRRNQITRQNDIQLEEIMPKPSFFGRIKNFFFPRKPRKDPKKSERLIRESDALEYSTIVLLAVQSLVKFLFILPKEDKFGVGQMSAEKILDILLTVKSTLDKTVNYAFISGPYQKGWFATGPMDLSLKTMETVDWGVKEILRHFPSQLDYSRLSHNNIQLAQRLLGRKLI